MLRRILFLLICLLPQTRAAQPAPPLRASVYAIQNRAAIQDYEADDAIIHSMVDALVERATGRSTAQQAWQSLVTPNDVVGIMVSKKGGPAFSTHPAIVEAVVEGLESAGVPRRNITIWDGIHGPRDVDPKAPVSAAVLGKLIWGDLMFKAGRDDTSSLSYLSRVLTGKLTKIINLPVFCSSEGNGMAGAIYNLTIPNLDNWRRLTLPPNYGDPDVAELYADPRIGPKVALTIMDGLIAQYAGGPDFRPNYAFAHATLYASKDPVALDATALALVEEWRKQAKLPPIGPIAAYLKTAAQLGYGIADPALIDVIKVP